MPVLNLAIYGLVAVSNGPGNFIIDNGTTLPSERVSTGRPY